MTYTCTSTGRTHALRRECHLTVSNELRNRSKELEILIIHVLGNIKLCWH